MNYFVGFLIHIFLRSKDTPWKGNQTGCTQVHFVWESEGRGRRLERNSIVRRGDFGFLF